MSDSEYVLYASEKRSCILCAVFRANDVSELSWPTMNIALPPDLLLEIRKIRNIEVWRSDLSPLITGKAKIPSTPINAFGAQLQVSDSSHQDCIHLQGLT